MSLICEGNADDPFAGKEFVDLTGLYYEPSS